MRAMMSIKIKRLLWTMLCGFVALGGSIVYLKRTRNVEAIKIERLESRFATSVSVDNTMDVLLQDPKLSQQFFKIKDLQDKDTCRNYAQELFDMYKNPKVLDLYEQTNKQFADLSLIEKELALAFKRLKSYFPDVKVPQVYSIITGMRGDAYIGDDGSFIVIGLDYFLGEQSKYQFVDIPPYIAQGYSPDTVALKVMLLYVERFAQYDPMDKTLLGRMIYYGKILFLAQKLFPAKAEHLLLGYTKEQLREVNGNKTYIWDHFVDNELFYSTDRAKEVSYINPSPHVIEIGPECPGSIGKWLGFDIVKQYMRNCSKEKVRKLMACRNSKKIFKDSCYRPKDIA